MNTPTTAAMRAAKAAQEYIGNGMLSPESLAAEQIQIAFKIDRETGLPELIAACEFALQTFNCDPHRGGFNGEDAAIRRLQLALEKAK